MRSVDYKMLAKYILATSVVDNTIFGHFSVENKSDFNFIVIYSSNKLSIFVIQNLHVLEC